MDISTNEFEEMRGCVERLRSLAPVGKWEESAPRCANVPLWRSVTAVTEGQAVGDCARLFVRWCVNKHFVVVLPVPALRS